MEDNSRRNSKMQNPMYELSHGSNTQTPRHRIVQLGLLLVTGYLYLVKHSYYAFYPWAIAVSIEFIFRKQNESKNGIERKTGTYPIKSISKPQDGDLWCLLCPHIGQIEYT
jgi:hypothetical protein